MCSWPTGSSTTTTAPRPTSEPVDVEAQIREWRVERLRRLWPEMTAEQVKELAGNVYGDRELLRRADDLAERGCTDAAIAYRILRR